MLRIFPVQLNDTLDGTYPPNGGRLHRVALLWRSEEQSREPIRRQVLEIGQQGNVW